MTGTDDVTRMNVVGQNHQLLAKLLDANALQQRVISQNISNVNTPGYKTLEVSFEETLEQLANGDSPESVKAQPQIVPVEGLPQRLDGNNVDIDEQIGQLNKNALLNQVYSQVLLGKIGMMRSAIKGS